MTTVEERLGAVERFVQERVAGYDASHDFSHISRVVATARSLAADCNCSPQQQHVIHITALLHDLPDPKYCADPAAVLTAISTLLTSLAYPPSDIAYILSLLPLLSFKDQLTSSSSPSPSFSPTSPPALPLEAAVVSDADKLDAIGAIGVARCFTFGATRHRPLYTPADLSLSPHSPPPPPSPTAYRAQQVMQGTGGASSLLHFHDKLLHLRGMMQTEVGRRRAEARHRFMVDFIMQLQRECGGEG